MRRLSLIALLFMANIASAQTTILTFDPGDPIGGLSIGSSLSNQYAAFGVTFSPNAFSGPGGPNGDWATNTNLIVVSSTGSDVGGLGTPSLVSGNIIRSFNGWLNEDGDPSLAAAFTVPVSSISVDFAGIANPGSTRIFVRDNTNALLATLVAAGTGQQNLSFTAGPGQTIGSLQITPGDFFDWAGFDNFSYTVAAVPEPTTWALMGIAGVGTAAAIRWHRRRRATKVRGFSSSRA